MYVLVKATNYQDIGLKQFKTELEALNAMIKEVFAEYQCTPDERKEILDIVGQYDGYEAPDLAISVIDDPNAQIPGGSFWQVFRIST